jgi:hypothetical protein
MKGSFINLKIIAPFLSNLNAHQRNPLVISCTELMTEFLNLVVSRYLSCASKQLHADNILHFYESESLKSVRSLKYGMTILFDGLLQWNRVLILKEWLLGVSNNLKTQ